MNSNEIKTFNGLGNSLDFTWLREIAYQLAVLNERQSRDSAQFDAVFQGKVPQYKPDKLADPEPGKRDADREPRKFHRFAGSAHGIRCTDCGKWHRDCASLEFCEPGTADADRERGRWRVGKRVPLNVYEGDRPVCQCHSFMDAMDIVAAMNAVSTERSQASPHSQPFEPSSETSAQPQKGADKLADPQPGKTDADRERGRIGWGLFHRLWSKAVGTADYDKREWTELEELLPQTFKPSDLCPIHGFDAWKRSQPFSPHSPLSEPSSETSAQLPKNL